MGGLLLIAECIENVEEHFPMTYLAIKDIPIFSSYLYARYTINVRFQQVQKPANLYFKEAELSAMINKFFTGIR